MRRYLLLLLSFCALAIVAVVVLQPDPAIRIEAELSRLPPDDALNLLETEDLYGREDRNIALVHARLSLENGNFQKSRELYEDIAKATPEDARSHDELSKIAMLAGDRNRAFAELEKAYAIAPSQPRREQLAALYRLDRNVAAEVRLLSSVPHNKLSAWEVERLSDLMIQSGHLDEVEILYREVADSAGPASSSARDRLVIFLIDEARADEALASALNWYAQSDFDIDLLQQLLPVFINRGAVDQAKYLAEQAMKNDPDTGYLLVRQFAKSGHRLTAGKFEDQILARRDVLTEPEWRSIIDLAATTGDLHGLQTALSKRGNQSAPEAVLGEALLQFLRYRGSRALVPYGDLISDDLASEAPLVAAAYAFEHGLYADSVAYLVEAAQQKMSGWDTTIWMSIAQRLRVSGHLRQLALSEDLPPHLQELLRAEVALASQ